ncbi:MAG TPA: protocatechuate 3,4-dioxygenase [Terriglobia bacterium]|nr:protocatechuate 3,4-dioxygenase [Terriglobia bacterium]
MADLVIGIATSHSPLLSTPPEQWDLRANADRENRRLYFRGRAYDFETLVWARAPGFGNQTFLDVRQERYWRCQRALDTLRAKLIEIAPDAVVIVGNDQREIFSDSLTPAITVYRGSEIENIPFTDKEPSPGLAIAEHGNCPAGGAVYPGCPEFADHIIESLIGNDFDVAESSSLPRSVLRPGVPHAFGFVYHRLLGDTPPPSVPIIFNVHYPPNRPLLRRCLAFGHALRRAIRSWDGARRVALIASGGLSHFVIDEALDARVLSAMETGNEDVLARMPEELFCAGTAEIKNWLPVVAAMNEEHRRFHKVDYVPCYRSEAGTGNAMGFVYWE